MVANIQLMSSFKCNGDFLGKKQDELVAMLEAEEDFRSSSTLLEERMAEMGARLVLLPKFHPEFNPIECVYRCKNQMKRRKTIWIITPGMWESSAGTGT